MEGGQKGPKTPNVICRCPLRDCLCDCLVVIEIANRLKKVHVLLLGKVNFQFYTSGSTTRNENYFVEDKSWVHHCSTKSAHFVLRVEKS